MGIELRYTCLNCKPSQSTRLPPGVSGTSRTSGNLASDRPDWVDSPRTPSAFGNGKSGQERCFHAIHRDLTVYGNAVYSVDAQLHRDPGVYEACARISDRRRVRGAV